MWTRFAIIFAEMIHAKNILICRNDAIGDTILALPMCGVIKQALPDVKITFLGTAYTRPVVAMSQYVDDFVDYNEVKSLEKRDLKKYFADKGVDVAILMKSDKEMAKVIANAGIRYRIGMLTWLKHWTTCNRFVHFSRSKSDLNEAQLNLKMLTPLGIDKELSLAELPSYYGFTRVPVLNFEWKKLLDLHRINLILHPKTTGHGREWPLEKFGELIQTIDPSRYKIFISGGKGDHDNMKDWLLSLHSDVVVDLSGKLSLDQFLAFIHEADGMVAGSTGPVHLAAALGIHALGLYTDLRSRNASRWFPVGKYGEALECQNDDMNTISVTQVLERVNVWNKIQRP